MVGEHGLNYNTYETDFMTTNFNSDNGRGYSLVVGYGYNSENDDTDYKSGDEFLIKKWALQMKTKELLSSIRRANLLSTPDFQAVKFEVFTDKMVISKN